VIFPHEDKSVLVTGGDVPAVRRIIDFGGGISVALEYGFGAERGSVQFVDVDVLVVTADCDLRLVGGEGEGGGGVGDVLGMYNAAVLYKKDLLLEGTGQGEASSVGSHSQAEGLATERDLLAGEVRPSAGDTEGIVNGNCEHVVALEAKSDDGVLVTISADGLVFAGLSVPPGHNGIVASCVESVGGPVIGDGVDGLVVAGDDLAVRTRAVLVQVGQVTTEGQGDKVGSLPDATNLHILNSGAELEGTTQRERESC